MTEKQSAVSTDETNPLIGVIMGSRSDWETMREASELLGQLQIPFESRVVSAHRTPRWMVEYAETAAGRGLKVIIAGAGGAAELGRFLAARSEPAGQITLPHPPAPASGHPGG